MKKYVHQYQKEEVKERQKCKQLIMKGNLEAAQIHAENAIRNSNQAKNFLVLSARVDAIASKLKSAIMMKQVTKNIEGIVKAMNKAVQNMEVDGIARTMNLFEKQFENLDVQQACIEESMASSTTTTVPQNQVESLMSEIAEEAGLDIKTAMPQPGRSTLSETRLENILKEMKKSD